MKINFIPNDPAAVRSLPMRVIVPRRNPPPSRAGFDFGQPFPVGRYAPDTPEFVYWQSREAALRTLATWESIHGPLLAWRRGVRRLPLRVSGAGTGLNAYYQRHRLLFTHDLLPGGKPFYAAASSDFVAHEVGHALLDVLRPTLFDSFFAEVSAFHESFGDCMAMLTMINDDTSRRLVMKHPRALDRHNCFEAFGEAMGKAVARVEGPDSDSAAPRFALNRYRWDFHYTLPKSGKPSLLTSEPHSFSRVFTGCFYDLIRNIAGESPTGAKVLRAANLAGRLLVQAADRAPLRVRFFKEVGQAMLLEDAVSNGAEYAAAIRAAFRRHGVLLDDAATLPQAARTRGMRAMPPFIGAQPATLVKVRHDVSLAGLGVEFRDVVVEVPEQVVVPAMRTRGMQPMAPERSDSGLVEQEVRSFVETLLEHGQVALSTESTASRTDTHTRGMAPATTSRAATPSRNKPTHVIRQRGTKRVLERVRFACQCRPGGRSHARCSVSAK